MEQPIVRVFKEGVSDFKQWAKQNNKYFGEWETEYPRWLERYTLAQSLLKEVPIEKWDRELIHDFLYLVARDNEMEEILFYLMQHPETFMKLAEHAVNFSENDARWQIANALGEVKVNRTLVNKLLQEFLKDEHEYVRRRALFAIEPKIDDVFTEVFNNLIGRGYSFELGITVHSSTELEVEYLINTENLTTVCEEVYRWFFGAVRKNELDSIQFKLIVRNNRATEI